jgi:hypothetical protein
MNLIVQMKCGSHLYGTATKNSDLDIKGVYIPHAQEILLQKVKPVISVSPHKSYGEKNTPKDIDYEFFSVARFLSLIAEGQSVALEMLFVPKQALISKPQPLWQEIKIVSYKLFNKKTASFVHYCKQQANKYGIKGLRITAARMALEYLIKAESQYGSTVKLAVAANGLDKLVMKNEFLTIGEYINANGTSEKYFEICGKRMLFNASIKSSRLVAQKLVEQYGQRALAAENNQGIDWKALSHAIRVGREAIEFLTTQNLTFPRPEAKHLNDIKSGVLSFHQISEEIEQILIEVDHAALHSKLPISFDQTIIEKFIEQVYKQQILNYEAINVHKT